MIYAAKRNKNRCPTTPARCFATTLFRQPAGPRPRSRSIGNFRASTLTTSSANESRYLLPSPCASPIVHPIVNAGKNC